MAADRRAGAGEYAARVNAAAELVEAGVPLAEVARTLAGRFGVSARQARRYAEQAATSGRVRVPETSVVFTVKLPGGLAERVRAHARKRGITISAVVTRALTEFFARGRGEDLRR